MPPQPARPTRRNSGKNLIAPRRSPEDLAELVSCLSNQEKAELTYELVYFAALAAVERDVTALNAVLAELEDMAEVAADPQRRRELQKAVAEEASAQREKPGASQRGAAHPPVNVE